jgi:hypothetical protein
MRLTYLFSAIVLLVLVCGPRLAWGQMRSGAGGMGGGMGGMGGGMGGSSSMFGGGSMGRSSMGGMGGGMGGMGGGMGGMGSSGMGSMGMGSMGGSNNTLGIGLGSSALGIGNTATTTNRTGMQGMGGMTSPYTTSGMGMMGRQNMNGGNMMGMGSGMGNGIAIRTQLSVGFDTPLSETPKVNSALTKRLADLPSVHWSSPGQVVIQGRTAILRGVVASAHDRELAERVMSLEPGVSQVDNQLVVGSDSSKSAAPPLEAPHASSTPRPSAPATTAKEPAAANSQKS